MKLETRWFVTLAIIAVILPSAFSSAQSFMDEPGVPAFTTSFPVEHGFINLANGNLHIEIPIATYPERGNLKALHPRLVYDSRFWIVREDPVSGISTWTPNGVGSSGVNVGGGFRFITDGEPGTVSFSESSQQCACIASGTGLCQPYFRTTFTNYVYQAADGTNHRAPGTGANAFKLFSSPNMGSCGGQVPTGTTRAGDGSGFEFVINNGSVTMYHPDGTVEPVVSTSGAPSLQDTNGNFYAASEGADSTVWNVVDPLGRIPVLVTRSGNQVFLDYLCGTGCPAGTTRARVTINTVPVTWVTHFNQVGVGEYSGPSGTALQSVVFPDGSTYSFVQDSYGMITNMTLPTGGQITYGYSNFSDYQGNVNRWVTSRISDGQTWSFNPVQIPCSTMPCTMQVTVTTPPYNDGNTTASDNRVYTFTQASGGAWNTQTQYFRGSVGGTPVLTKTTDYGIPGTQCPAIAGFAQVSLPIRDTLTWPTSSGTTLSKKAEYCYDTFLNVTTTKEWDYQPGGNFGANPDREIDNVYKSDSAYINANILRLLQSTTRKDGSGNQVAQTTYGYDEYSTQGLALQPSGVTTGYTAPAGPRANQTSVTRWLNTSTTPVISNTAYYDTGEVYQGVDPLRHTSTIYYDSTGAYPSKSCNAANQCSYSAYDFNTGLLTTSTDSNGSQLGDALHTTNYTFDSMLRPLCTNLPDGGQTCLSYPNPNTANRQQKITAALTDFSSTILDSLGRVSQTQHSLPTCTAKVDTTYDPLGRIFSVSNPYCSTSETTYGITQTYYDALSRPASVIKQDGSATATAYSANCKTLTDEKGNSRRLCFNGFGGLIEVDEPNSTAQGTDATASVTLTGSLASAKSGTGSAPLPLSGSPLTSFVSPDGSSHIFYLASGQHVLHMFWNSSGSWQDEDLFSTTGAVPASNSALSGVALTDGTLHVFYTGANQHIYQFVYSSGAWQSQDLTAITGNTLAASATALASDSGAAGEPIHLYYLGTNQHIYCLFVSGTAWQNQDLTAATGNTLAAAGSKLAVSVLPDGTTRLFYLGANQHVYQLFRNNGGSFGTPYLASTDYTDAQGWYSSAYYPSIRLADVNGDGKPDVCGRGQAGVGCALNNGNGTFAARQQWETSFSDAVGWNQLPYGSTFMFADLNGDNKADVCARGISGIICEPSTGAAFGAGYYATTDYNDAQGWNSAYYYPSLRLADVNGDGKPDVCGRGSGGISCSLNNGSGSFGPYQQWGTNFTDANGWNQPQYTSTIMFADINGDGKADVCGRGQAGIICALSNGAGFGTPYLATSDFSDAQGWNNAAYYPSIRLADVNGDGKPDVCGRSASGVVCALNNGNGTFGPARQWDGNFTDAGGWNQAQYTSTIMFADINGDGRADLCGRGVAGIWCALSAGNASWQNQDLTAITGNTLAVSGSSLTSDAGAAGNPVHLYYIGTNQHIYALFWNSSTTAWANSDLTAATGNNLPAAGSQLSVTVGSDGTTHVFYLGSDQHVYQLLCCTSGWQNQDLTAITGNTLALAGTAVTSTGSSAGNTVHLYYQAGTLHLNHMYLTPTPSWVNQDLSTMESTLVSDSGTVSLTAAGFTATACFGPSTNPACSGQQFNDTSSAVARTLAQAFNVSGSTVSATATGSTINFTLLQPGPFTPPISALTTAHDNSSLFSNPSFTSAAAVFANGTGTSLTNGYTTLYSYDALGNLTCVEQHGTAATGTGCSASPTSDATSPWRVRRFTYDSLSRLLTAKNPESGTLSYSYDADGNLLQKVSPAPNQTGAATQTISYCYDTLHRVVGKAYSAQSCPLSTPVVTYTYDVGTNGIGHLTSLTDQAGSASFAFDNLGRMASETRILSGVSKSMSYEYNLNSSIKAAHYPSGSIVSYAPDSAGHMLSAVDLANAINYVTSASYQPDGQIAGSISANSTTFAGITNSFTYNKRLQPTTISASSASQTVFSIGYDFHAGNGGFGTDNGNIWNIYNYRDHTRDQSFGYDSLNRLSSAQNAGTDCTAPTLNGKTKFWGNSYGYDPWANLLSKSVTKCSADHLTVSALTSNQLSGYGYDAAGNMTSDSTDQVTSTYDPENRIATASTPQGTFTYTYDADGNRVEKSGGGSGTFYWYMTVGIVAESDLTGTLKSEYVFFNGNRVARRDFGTPGAVFYYISDRLKSTSVITDSGGNIKEEYDYDPWGGERQFINNDSNHYKFTGKERDAESGLDYFGARYYSNALGRFITPDWAAKATAVPYAEFSDPQSLDLYSYVRNIPSVTFDEDGHDWNKVKEYLKEAFKGTSIKVSVGIGIGGKATEGPASGRAELAIKGNVELTGQGKLSGSMTIEGGVSGEVAKTKVGLAGSATQVLGSIDLNTGERSGLEKPTGEYVPFFEQGGKSVEGSSEGGFSIGYEEGEGALGGGQISLSPEALTALKNAATELKQTIFGSDVPDTKQQTQAPLDTKFGAEVH